MSLIVGQEEIKVHDLVKYNKYSDIVTQLY